MVSARVLRRVGWGDRRARTPRGTECASWDRDPRTRRRWREPRRARARGRVAERNRAFRDGVVARLEGSRFQVTRGCAAVSSESRHRWAACVTRQTLSRNAHGIPDNADTDLPPRRTCTGRALVRNSPKPCRARTIRPPSAGFRFARYTPESPWPCPPNH
jgi:hypothetical protein